MIRLLYKNTDKERLAILKSFNSFVKLEISEDFCNQIIGEEKEDSIEYYYSIFEKLEVLNDFNKQKESQENKEYQCLYDKALMFVSHYYLVMYMAIQRGELQADVANYYGFSFPFEIPCILNEDNLFSVAEKLFLADSARINDGGKFFLNPSIGTVKVWVEKFYDAFKQRQNKQITNKACVENIDVYRKEADNLVFWIFNFLTKRFQNYPQNELKTLFADFNINIDLEFPQSSESNVINETNNHDSLMFSDSQQDTKGLSDEYLNCSQDIRINNQEYHECSDSNSEILACNENKSDSDQIIIPAKARKPRNTRRLVEKEQLQFDLFF